jgi:hypothetical protein
MKDGSEKNESDETGPCKGMAARKHPDAQKEVNGEVNGMLRNTGNEYYDSYAGKQAEQQAQEGFQALSTLTKLPSTETTFTLTPISISASAAHGHSSAPRMGRWKRTLPRVNGATG